MWGSRPYPGAASGTSLAVAGDLDLERSGATRLAPKRRPVKSAAAAAWGSQGLTAMSQTFTDNLHTQRLVDSFESLNH